MKLRRSMPPRLFSSGFICSSLEPPNKTLQKPSHSERCSGEHCESLCLDFHEKPPKPPDVPIKACRGRFLEIAEKARGPRLEVALEKALFRCEIGFEIAPRHSGHDLAEDRYVILRLRDVIGAGDADRRHVLADLRERALLQKAGQIVGRIRQEFAAADADEEIEIFAGYRIRVDIRRRLGERGMSPTELRRIAGDFRKACKKLSRRGFCKNGSEQPIFAGARERDVINLGGLLGTIQRRKRRRRSKEMRGISDAA